VDYQVLDTVPPTLARDDDNWLPLLPSIGVLWRY